MKKAFCALAVSCLGIGMTVAAVRMQVNYTFKNYGGTKVDLPE